MSRKLSSMADLKRLLKPAKRCRTVVALAYWLRQNIGLVQAAIERAETVERGQGHSLHGAPTLVPKKPEKPQRPQLYRRPAERKKLEAEKRQAEKLAERERIQKLQTEEKSHLEEESVPEPPRDKLPVVYKYRGAYFEKDFMGRFQPMPEDWTPEPGKQEIVKLQEPPIRRFVFNTQLGWS